MGRRLYQAREPYPDPSPVAGPVSDDRPWTRSGFWILQLVVLTLYARQAGGHRGLPPRRPRRWSVEFSTLALFIIPVVYAALNYGFARAPFTSGWLTVWPIPRFVTSRQRPRVRGRLGRADAGRAARRLGLLIGQRVSAERAARRLAEISREAHLNAEAMYRDLFDSNQAPILIVDGDGHRRRDQRLGPAGFRPDQLPRPTLAPAAPDRCGWWT